MTLSCHGSCGFDRLSEYIQNTISKSGREVKSCPPQVVNVGSPVSGRRSIKDRTTHAMTRGDEGPKGEWKLE